MLIIAATAIWDFSSGDEHTALDLAYLCILCRNRNRYLYGCLEYFTAISYSRRVLLKRCGLRRFGSFGLSPLGIAAAGPLAELLE
jgi:hypothetical protein